MIKTIPYELIIYYPDRTLLKHLKIEDPSEVPAYVTDATGTSAQKQSSRTLYINTILCYYMDHDQDIEVSEHIEESVIENSKIRVYLSSSSYVGPEGFMRIALSNDAIENILGEGIRARVITQARNLLELITGSGGNLSGGRLPGEYYITSEMSNYYVCLPVLGKGTEEDEIETLKRKAGKILKGTLSSKWVPGNLYVTKNKKFAIYLGKIKNVYGAGYIRYYNENSYHGIEKNPDPYYSRGVAPGGNIITGNPVKIFEEAEVMFMTDNLSHVGYQTIIEMSKNITLPQLIKSVMNDRSLSQLLIFKSKLPTGGVLMENIINVNYIDPGDCIKKVSIEELNDQWNNDMTKNENSFNNWSYGKREILSLCPEYLDDHEDFTVALFWSKVANYVSNVYSGGYYSGNKDPLETTVGKTKEEIKAALMSENALSGRIAELFGKNSLFAKNKFITDRIKSNAADSILSARDNYLSKNRR